MPLQRLRKTSSNDERKERNMVWYGSPEYNTRLKAAAKRIALDYILEELLIQVSKLHKQPIESLNELHAKVHSRFILSSDPGHHESHVQAEAARFAEEYFDAARNSIQNKAVPGDD